MSPPAHAQEIIGSPLFHRRIDIPIIAPVPITWDRLRCIRRRLIVFLSFSTLFFNTSKEFCISDKVTSCFMDSILAFINSVSNVDIVLCASFNSSLCFMTKDCASVNGRLDVSIKLNAFSLLLFNSFHCVKGIVMVGSAWLVEDVPEAKDGEEHNSTDNIIKLRIASNCRFDFFIHIYPLYITAPLLSVIFSFHSYYIATTSRFITLGNYP